MKKKTILLAMIMALVFSAVATGCAQSTKDNLSIPETGQIILSVNPEIAVHYNKDGLVTNIEGVNDDGKIVVSNVSDYIGRNCRDVVKDLVKQINEDGHFVANENGIHNDITIHVVPGSHLPNEKFLNNITDDVRQTVSEMNLNTNVVVRGGESGYGRTDYNGDSQYGNSNNSNSRYNDSAYGNSNNNSGYDSPDVKPTPQPSNNSGNNSPAVKPTPQPNNNSGYNSPEVKPTPQPSNNSGYNSPEVRPTPQPNNNPVTKSAPQQNNNSDYGNSGYSGYGNSGYSGYGNS